MADSTFHKKDIIDKVAEKTDNVTKKDVIAVCNNFLKTVRDQIVEGNTITLTGFGKFYSAISRRQTGRDINQGKPITFPKRRVVHFKASTTLRKDVKKKNK